MICRVHSTAENIKYDQIERRIKSHIPHTWVRSGDNEVFCCIDQAHLQLLMLVLNTYAVEVKLDVEDAIGVYYQAEDDIRSLPQV